MCGRMDGQKDGWMDEQTEEQKDGWTDGQDRWVGGWIDDGRMERWKDRRVDRIDGWVDGRISG